MIRPEGAGMILPRRDIISREVICVSSYVAPEMRERFESLSIDLKNEILRRDVKINSLQDLIDCLQAIVDGE